MSSFDLNERRAARWRFDLAYDGEGLQGFAYQPDGLTVVGLLRSTLARTLRLPEEPHLDGAGRTDTGVHAYAQVVSVTLPDPLFLDDRGEPVARLVRSLNLQLRGRVRVLRALRVPDDFHARYSALWREYRYLVLESAPPALELEARFSWSVAGPLDLEAMNAACEDLLGLHDFRAFCRRPPDKAADDPLNRLILAARWTRHEDTWQLSPDGASALKFTIRAESFCHNMVRALTGALVAVGQGKLPVSAIAEHLASHERTGLPGPAPSAGLTLVGVGYDKFAGGPSGFVG